MSTIPQTIRIDPDVWLALKARAEPLVDTVNDVLRRLLGLEKAGGRSTRTEAGQPETAARQTVKIEWSDRTPGSDNGGTKLVLTLNGRAEEIDYPFDRLDDALKKAKQFLEDVKPRFANLPPRPQLAPLPIVGIGTSPTGKIEDSPDYVRTFRGFPRDFATNKLDGCYPTILNATLRRYPRDWKFPHEWEAFAKPLLLKPDRELHHPGKALSPSPENGLGHPR